MRIVWIVFKWLLLRKFSRRGRNNKYRSNILQQLVSAGMEEEMLPCGTTENFSLSWERNYVNQCAAAGRPKSFRLKSIVCVCRLFCPRQLIHRHNIRVVLIDQKSWTPPLGRLSSIHSLTSLKEMMKRDGSRKKKRKCVYLRHLI